MNARGTRRPHPRRVRSKPRRSSGGSAGTGPGCLDLMALAVAIVASPAVVLGGLWLVTR